MPAVQGPSRPPLEPSAQDLPGTIAAFTSCRPRSPRCSGEAPAPRPAVGGCAAVPGQVTPAQPHLLRSRRLRLPPRTGRVSCSAPGSLEARRFCTCLCPLPGDSPPFHWCSRDGDWLFCCRSSWEISPHCQFLPLSGIAVVINFIRSAQKTFFLTKNTGKGQIQCLLRFSRN